MPSVIFSPVSAAINHLLARELWARERLMRHTGKIVLFDAQVAAIRLKVAVDGMVQPTAADEPATVTIRAKLADLPLIAQNRKHAFSYVQIEGDADFANTVSQLGESLRWEAEEDLAKWVGDIPAARLVGGARAVIETARSTQQKLAENLAEYLLEENPVLVRPRAVEEFGVEVVTLRDDVERLAKRIEKLKGSR